MTRIDSDHNRIAYGDNDSTLAMAQTIINDLRLFKCHYYYVLYIFTLWLFSIAMKNGPFIDDFPIKTSIYKGFSMAMLNNQRVNIYKS